MIKEGIQKLVKGVDLTHQEAKEIMKDVECRMLMIWEGTITKTDLGAIQLHTKIMDDMRERFNKIHRKWVGKE